MANRLRVFFESIVYAGLKPSARNMPGPTSPKRKWIALLIGGAAILLGASYYAIGTSAPRSEPPPPKAELNVNNIKLDGNRNLSVTEVRFEHGASDLILGALQNISDRVIREAVVEFDLADDSGARLGSVSVTEVNLPPGSVRPFQRPFQQRIAQRATIRLIRTQ